MDVAGRRLIVTAEIVYPQRLVEPPREDRVVQHVIHEVLYLRFIGFWIEAVLFGEAFQLGVAAAGLLEQTNRVGATIVIGATAIPNIRMQTALELGG